MAIQAQTSLFEWSDYKNSGDLEKLNLILDTIPDEDLMRMLELHTVRSRSLTD